MRKLKIFSLDKQSKDIMKTDENSKEINKRLQRLFSNIPLSVLSQLKFDSEAIFSVTNQYIAIDICKNLLKIKGITNESKVTDATACIGGNVFSFMKFFKKVDAIEIDPIKCEMLKHNISVLGENYINIDNTRVNIIQGNCLDFIIPTQNKKVTQDILFIDPPWGGNSYKDTLNLNLYLQDSLGNEIELFDIIKMLNSKTKVIVLKVPINYNLSNIQKVTDTYKIESIKGYSRPNSMNIIILSLIK